ncbi:hypothetical protein TNCT_649211 [Trichonephila clavata]|uniref:Uncharacterized protein n=1 Tax=Trichonephila clavata TaxID=2740835 RepID=A0A8X6GA87_TRICU|nr:hypothetical protein TNCT_649211 [Trichonephila clavata]
MAEQKFDSRNLEYTNFTDEITPNTNVCRTQWDKDADTLDINMTSLKELCVEKIKTRECVEVQLLSAKSRVPATGKGETALTRLKLLGAAIASRLASTIMGEITHEKFTFG